VVVDKTRKLVPIAAKANRRIVGAKLLGRLCVLMTDLLSIRADEQVPPVHRGVMYDDGMIFYMR